MPNRQRDSKLTVAKRARRNSKMSDSLAEILDVVRLFPADADMPDVPAMINDICEKDPSGYFDQARKAHSSVNELDLATFNPMEDETGDKGGLRIDLQKAKNAYIREALIETSIRFALAFRDYLRIPEAFIDQSGPEMLHKVRQYSLELNDAIHRFTEAVRWYRESYRLVELLLPGTERPRSTWEQIASDVFRRQTVQYTVPVKLNENRLILEPDLFLEAFVEQDLTNLRKCAHAACGKIFWAVRKDQKACTRSCANSYRTRNWRNKTTPEQRKKYKWNRYKKEIDIRTKN